MPTLDNNLDIVVRSQYESSGLDKAEQNVQKLADSTSSAANRMRQDFGSVTSILTALGATALAGATVNAVKFGVQTSASFEQSRVAFENMLGNTQKARDLLAQLSEFAAKTPFELPEVVDAGKQLLAYGVAADQVKEKLTLVGDAAAKMGVPVQQAIDVWAKAKAGIFEIREFAPLGVTREALEQFGVQFKKTGELVNSSSLLPALEKMWGSGGTVGMMEQQSHTLSGVMSNLQDDIGRVVRTIMGINEQGDIRSGSLFDVLKVGATQLESKMQDLIKVNPQVITSIVVATGAVAAFGATVVAVGGSIALLTAILGGPLTIAFALLSAVVGVGAYQVMQRFQDKMKDTGKTTQDSLKAMADSGKENLPKLGQMSQDVADKIADIDRSIAKTKRNYIQQLADMVDAHQKKVDELNSGIADENSAFSDANDKRLQDFKDKNDQMTADHQKRVAQIEAQIKNETYTDAEANQTKIANLRASLDQENADYQQQTDKLQAQYQQDTTNAQKEHDKKLADLQKQLDTELAFQKKHEADIASVKNVARLDEIQKLQQSTNDSIAEYERQKQKAIDSSNQATTTFTSNAQSASDAAQKAAKDLSDSLIKQSNDLTNALKSSVTETGQSWLDKFTDGLVGIGQFIGTGSAFSDIKGGGNPIWEKITKAFDFLTGGDLNSSNYSVPHRATGGPVSAGKPYWVGDGGEPELFIPKQSGTIVPQSKMGGGVTIYQTNHIYNQTDTLAAARELGFQLAR